MPMKIVAANGFPVNTIGWLAPVVTDGERCFILGTSPKRDFPYADLSELEKEELLILLQEVLLGGDLNAHKVTQQNKTHGYALTLPLYVLYFQPQLIQDLENSLWGNNSGTSNLILARCEETGKKIEPKSTDTAFHFRIVPSEELKGLLKECFRLVCDRIHELLMEYVGDEDAIVRVNDLLEPSAGVLYEFAFDKNSAREAIILRSVTTAAGPNPELVSGWILGAAEAWGLESSIEFWNEKAHSLLDSLAVRKRLVYPRAFASKQALMTTTPIAPETASEDIVQNKPIYENRSNVGYSTEGSFKDDIERNYDDNRKV